MFTSGEYRLRDGVPVLLRALPYSDPVAQQLIELVQEEYVQRYGGRDGAVVDPAEFEPPHGLFLSAEAAGRPVGCGAWRRHAAEVAEIKRMYVAPAHRRQGLARVILAELEASAGRAGFRSVVLNSGLAQPEALALYAAAGYEPVAPYGLYAGSRRAVFLGKVLGTGAAEPAGPGDRREQQTWAS